MPSIGVLEHNQKPTDKPTRRIKRSGGQSLVKRGFAVWITQNVLLKLLAVAESRLPSRPEAQYSGSGAASEPRYPGRHSGSAPPNSGRQERSEPSQSPRMGKLRWEPPKHKRDLKAHPWANMIAAGR